LREMLEKELATRKATYATLKKDFYKWKVKALEEVIEFFEHEFFPAPMERKNATCEADTLTELYDEVVFFYNYYNSKQLALKVFMNTFYGETGNSLSPFFIKQVAGGITTYGQKNIKMVKAYVESKGCDVKYGDTDSLYVSPPEAV